MKNNKFFVVIMVAVIVFAGTTFEVKAINWKDYMPDVPAWINGFVNTLTDYKNRFVAFMQMQRNKEIKQSNYLEQAKAVVMGTAYYTEMLDRMKNFKTDSNRREICRFMQTFVQNYVRSDAQTKEIVKREYDIFNNQLKALREANVLWSEIGCLTQLSPTIDKSEAFINAWAFFKHLKEFDAMWLGDATLDDAIERIEKIITKD
jgi:hypothetical protein